MIALLANPDSGSGEAEEVAEALRELGADVAQFSVDDVEAALAAKPARLVVAGGDGSLGPAASAAARADVELAVIPTGTANDFAHALDLPEGLDACELAVRGRTVRRLDVGRMDGRPFLNVASLGLPPAAAERAGGLKRFLGPLAYAVGALIAGMRARPVRCRVVGDGKEIFAGDAWQVTIACTGAFGAGSSVDADPADGRLDVVVIEAGSRARLALHAYGLRAGDVASQSNVRQVRCAAARVELPEEGRFNVDGEIVSAREPTFDVDRAAIAVVVG